ncbi:hypothetical protein PABG_11893 [Paracoccidioides brasiliensis Pb03]|nr:hypothetical protein PABG_11893 [Paracoccidioides brasiliensis Pb03]
MNSSNRTLFTKGAQYLLENDMMSCYQHLKIEELRLRLKHARAARGLLRDLEEEIRRFVGKYHENQTVAQDEVSEVVLPHLSHEERRKLQQDVGKERQKQKVVANSDSDDGEVVFVGRKAPMHNVNSKSQIMTIELSI